MGNNRVVKKQVARSDEVVDNSVVVTTLSLAEDVVARASSLAAKLRSLNDVLQSSGETSALKDDPIASGLNTRLGGAVRDLAFADDTLQTVADYLGVYIDL